MLTIEELLRRYPLLLLPVKGYCRMLLWYCHNEGHQMLLGNTDAQISKMFEYALRKYSAEPKQYWQIQIVRAPRVYMEQFSKDSYQNAVRNFAGNALRVATDFLLGPEQHDLVDYSEFENHRIAALNKFGEIRPCPQYVAPAWINDPDTSNERLSDAVRDHDDCQGACYGERFVPADKSWGDMFEIIGDNPNPYVNKSLAPALVNIPDHDPTKTLHFVNGDFGHHSNGIRVGNVVFDEVPYCNCAPLFFFQGEKLEIPEAITEMVTESERLKKEKERRSVEDSANRRAERAAEEKSEFARYFPNYKR